MNSKKKEFLISISIVFLFSLIIVLYVNYLLIVKFGFNQENFVIITLALLILGLGVFLSFSSSILNPLFRSDEKLQKSIKQTIHELNIPVSTIKLNTQMLEKTIEDERSLKRLKRIQIANDKLLKLYENMEYSIKKEIDKVEKQEFYLDEVILKNLENFEDMTKDIKIDINLEHILLNTDLNGFEMMLSNLLSNAIKYNSQTNPQISIKYEKNILSIFNKGEKIDTKNLFIIFEKYFQQDYQKSGFGLGLFMVKEYCDKNKISIKIDTLENGNQFNLNLKNIIK